MDKKHNKWKQNEDSIELIFNYSIENEKIPVIDVYYNTENNMWTIILNKQKYEYCFLNEVIEYVIDVNRYTLVVRFYKKEKINWDFLEGF